MGLGLDGFRSMDLRALGDPGPMDKIPFADEQQSKFCPPNHVDAMTGHSAIYGVPESKRAPLLPICVADTYL